MRLTEASKETLQLPEAKTIITKASASDFAGEGVEKDAVSRWVLKGVFGDDDILIPKDEC